MSDPYLPPGTTQSDIDAHLDGSAGGAVPEDERGRCSTCGHELIRDPFSGSKWEPGEDMICPQCDCQDDSAGKCVDCGKPWPTPADGEPRRCNECRCKRLMADIAADYRRQALRCLAEAHEIDGGALKLGVRRIILPAGGMGHDGVPIWYEHLAAVDWPAGTELEVLK